MNFNKIIGTAAIIGMLVVIYSEYKKRQPKPIKINK